MHIQVSMKPDTQLNIDLAYIPMFNLSVCKMTIPLKNPAQKKSEVEVMCDSKKHSVM